MTKKNLPYVINFFALLEGGGPSFIGVQPGPPVAKLGNRLNVPYQRRDFKQSETMGIGFLEDEKKAKQVFYITVKPDEYKSFGPGKLAERPIVMLIPRDFTRLDPEIADSALGKIYKMFQSHQNALLTNVESFTKQYKELEDLVNEGAFGEMSESFVKRFEKLGSILGKITSGTSISSVGEKKGE